MKKTVLILSVCIAIPCLIYAGFNLGMTGAVKSQVKELDKKVAEKIAADAAATSQQLSGTVARGKPIASAQVVIKDANGNSPATSPTTGSDGKYSINLTGLTFPLLLKVTDGTTTYFSIANASGTCNIHPFTDLVVRTYFKSSQGIADMTDAFANNFTSLGTIPSPEVIDPVKNATVSMIDTLIDRQGINSLTYNMFSSTFNAVRTFCLDMPNCSANS